MKEKRTIPAHQYYLILLCERGKKGDKIMTVLEARVTGKVGECHLQ